MRNSNIVRQWRERYEFDRAMAAEILGVDEVTIARWEQTLAHELPPDVFHFLCMVLGGEYYDLCRLAGVDEVA